jgi:hypothetical protein
MSHPQRHRGTGGSYWVGNFGIFAAATARDRANHRLMGMGSGQIPLIAGAASWATR